MHYLLHLLLLYASLGYILFQTTILTIAGWQQTSADTLYIHNDSDQTFPVCTVFADLRKPSKVVLDSAEQINLTSGANKEFVVPLGQYPRQVTDCNQQLLLQPTATFTNPTADTHHIHLSVHLASMIPNDPVTQCAEGVRLYDEDKPIEAQPLLEAGFTARKQATFANPMDLGNCALLLGLLRDSHSDYSGALEAYFVALTIFQESNDQLTTGITLNNIGFVYHTKSQFAEALDYYQQALTIWRKQGQKEFEGITLNNIGGIYDEQDDHAKALEYYQQALAISRELNNRAGEGAILNNIGAIYRTQGEYADALDYYQQALTIAQDIGDQSRQGTTLNNIAALYADLSQYDQSLQYYQQALTMERAAGDRNTEGDTLNNIGEVYRAQSRYAQALEYYQQALAIRRTIGDRSGEAVTLNNIGNYYYEQNRYAQALGHYQQALAIHHQLNNQQEEGSTLHNIGVVYSDQGQYAQALATLQQALTIRRTVGDRLGEGLTLHNIGNIYDSQGDYALALNYHRQALAIQQAIEDLAGEGATLNSIGAAYDNQGQYSLALKNYQQAQAILHKIGDRAAEVTVLNNIGEIYRTQKQYPRALSYYQQALTLVRTLGKLQYESVILENIGVVYEQQGQYVNAQSQYQKAITILESIRAVAGSEQGRTNFIAQHASLYERAAALYHHQKQNEQAFAISEHGRARAFLDSLATGIVQLSDDDASALLIHEQETYARYQSAQDALIRARVSNSPDPKSITDLQQELQAAQDEYNQATAAIQQRSDQLATLIPGRTQRMLDVSSVQKLLYPQATLVSYFVVDDQTLAFILTHDLFQTVSLPLTKSALTTQVQTLREFSNASEAYPASAIQLYDWLIAPLKSYLTTPYLLIVPHGVLHYLPFAALTNGEHFLVDDYTLTILPSASTLQFIQPHPSLTNTVPLIVGNPTSMEQPPLSHAEQEAQAIGDLLGVTPLLAEQATKETLYNQVAQASILHLAAHGSYDINDPLESTIYLAPTADGEDNGHLTVRDIYGWNLNATNLVVLSACETQVNELSAGNIVSAGDEIVGLTRAFFFAGAPSVLATLWSVDDASTAQLMEHFYANLQQGIDKAEALRQAQLTIRQDYPNPYYWAGFVLSGDGGPLNAKTLNGTH